MSRKHHRALTSLFTEDQEVSFTLAQGRYYGNWFCPHADDMLLQFYHGNFNEKRGTDQWLLFAIVKLLYA